MTSAKRKILADGLLRVAGLLLSLGLVTTALADEMRRPTSTRDYKSMSEEARAVYVAGMGDGLALAAKGTDEGSLVGAMEECNMSRHPLIVLIEFEKWLLDTSDANWENWEYWNEPAAKAFFAYIAHRCGI